MRSAARWRWTQPKRRAERPSRSCLERETTASWRRTSSSPFTAPRIGSGAPLLRVLDIKAALDPDGTARLAALAEALTIASRLPQERSRAVELAARGLGEAVAHGAPLATWIARLDSIAGSGIDAKRLASLLGKALGDRPVTSSELSHAGKARRRSARLERRHTRGDRRLSARARFRAFVRRAARADRRAPTRPGKPRRARRRSTGLRSRAGWTQSAAASCSTPSAR